MAKREQSPQLSRRSFLKRAGWIASALAASPLLLSPEQVAASDRTGFRAEPIQNAPLQRGTLRVGVLLPFSTAYPHLGNSLIAGMQLYLQQSRQQTAIELIREEIDGGYVLAQRKARELIADDRVDLLTGVVTPSVAAMLSSILEESGALMITTGTGANVARRIDQHPRIFRHSLHQWQANRAMAAWAVQNLGPRAFVASSFYDSGYDALYAANLGLEDAGGEVLDTRVTHTSPDENGLSGLMEEIGRADPDFVFAAYCGEQAVECVRAYTNSGLRRRTPLVGSAFLADEALLPTLGEAALGIKTALPWAAGLDNARNNRFTRAYRRRFRQPADAFALLGYEAAQLVVEAANVLDGQFSRTESFAEVLTNAEIDGPRGRLSMHPETQSTSSPLYLREVQWQGGGLGNVVIGELGSTAEQDEQTDLIRSSLKTGWLNPYLCT